MSEARKEALTVKGLKVRYGAIEAVKGINFTVYEGMVLAILGANGAGKTSTLRTISGIVPAAEGSISFYGEDITSMDAEKITKLGISHSPEGRQIFRDLTVEENLKAGAFTVKDRSVISSCFERVYNYFPRLKERKKQMGSTLSGGELQMLAIGRALMGDPKILLLDEPSLGLAPMVVRDIFSIINEIKKEGTTVIIVEQNALLTLKMADYGYVLAVGEMMVEGKASELMKDPKLIEAYLGVK